MVKVLLTLDKACKKEKKGSKLGHIKKYTKQHVCNCGKNIIYTVFYFV